MIEILSMSTIIAPITYGVTQMAKKATNINKRYLPMVATVLGMGLGATAFFLEADLTSRLWAGGISGLAAVGLSELGKKQWRATCKSLPFLLF
ncbi:holin [Pseudogracilibacillus auburnensis]|uniref:holin n=1 Tax=Pseudogracilibacillus auburnensis TaxID=1494959 RepID=UPI001A97BF3F|nr:holin [Pseudogracilibacillus auburnensis]MBO1002662.1 holin [Pseudogracilibacillus auburnensis]